MREHGEDLAELMRRFWVAVRALDAALAELQASVRTLNDRFNRDYCQTQQQEERPP